MQRPLVGAAAVQRVVDVDGHILHHHLAGEVSYGSKTAVLFHVEGGVAHGEHVALGTLAHVEDVLRAIE